MKRTILIGATRAMKLPALVLEHSIRRRTKADITIWHTFEMPTMPEPYTPRLRSRTGFSFIRFMLPQLAQFEGIGLYIDNDKIVLDDIEKLFALPMNGATVLRPPNLASVLLVDCAKARWNALEILADLDAGKFSYEELMQFLCIERPENVRCSIPVEWNSLDWYDERLTKLVHFTDMMRQPWRVEGHPLAWLWKGELKEALKSGAIHWNTVSEEMQLGHIVPSAVIPRVTDMEGMPLL